MYASDFVVAVSAESTNPPNTYSLPPAAIPLDSNVRCGLGVSSRQAKAFVDGGGGGGAAVFCTVNVALSTVVVPALRSIDAVRV